MENDIVTEAEYDGDTEFELNRNLKGIIKSGIKTKSLANCYGSMKDQYKTEEKRHSSHLHSGFTPEFDRILDRMDTPNTFTKYSSESDSHSDEEKQD